MRESTPDTHMGWLVLTYMLSDYLCKNASSHSPETRTEGVWVNWRVKILHGYECECGFLSFCVGPASPPMVAGIGSSPNCDHDKNKQKKMDL